MKLSSNHPSARNATIDVQFGSAAKGVMENFVTCAFTKFTARARGPYTRHIGKLRPKIDMGVGGLC